MARKKPKKKWYEQDMSDGANYYYRKVWGGTPPRSKKAKNAKVQ